MEATFNRSEHLADTRHGGIGGIASAITSPLASRTAGTPGIEVLMFLKASDNWSDLKSAKSSMVTSPS